MNLNYNCLLLALFILLLTACSSNDDNVDGAASDLSKQITVDVLQEYQTIDAFAVSDCWTVNYVGKYWDETAKDDIAKLLFSSEIVDGRAQGIGLSMWRFNMGAGTAEQGDASNITDKTRRAECFLNSNGDFDTEKHAGQQYFMSKAKQYGCNQFVLFSNSPPVQYTRNGKGYSTMGAYSNLKDEHYKDFAEYMVKVAAFFRNERGIDIDFISPVNEPQYDWKDPSQEGTAWQNNEVKRLTVELDNALEKSGLSTKILLSEAADWEYLYKEKNGAGRSNVIESFFGTSSANYVGNLTHVAPIIGGHSYWTDTSWSTLYNVRKQVAAAASAKNLKVYQTEWSMLGDGYDKDYPGHAAASYMDIALYMSKVIHHDLTNANVSSWSYWTSLDMERWGHKNRFLLIKVVPADGDYGDIEKSGSFEATRTLWVLGNYSRFIRPAYKRVALNITNQSNSFFGSAYVSPNKDKMVIVFTNLSDKAIFTDISLKGIDKQVDNIKVYLTSETDNLTEVVVPNDKYTIMPKTVATFVYSYK